jgi:hypothetical protein
VGAALGEHALCLRRRHATGDLLLVVNLRGALDAALPDGPFRLLLSTEDPRFGGAGGASLAGDHARIDGSGALLLEAARRS